jgi:hypothetical protein
MTPAQELLTEIRDDLRALNVWELLTPDTRDAVDRELARAGTGWPALIGPVTGEQTYRRLGLIRDTPGSDQ